MRSETHSRMSNNRDRTMGGLFPKKSHGKAVVVQEKRGRFDDDDLVKQGAAQGAPKKSKKVEVQKSEVPTKPVANAGTLFAIRRDSNKDFCQLMDQAGRWTQFACHELSLCHFAPAGDSFVADQNCPLS